MFLTGLNGGNFSIKEDPKAIVDHSLDLLENYLQSYQGLQLTKSFKINVKLLSIPHVNVMAEKDYPPLHKANAQDVVVGAFTINSAHPRWEYTFPGISNDPFFKNMCLILALFIGMAKFKQPEKFKLINAWRNQNAKKVHFQNQLHV